MTRRIDDLTEFAKPVADDLADRMGSLKRVLSAGVLALADLSPDKREYYMAKSVGKEPLNPAIDSTGQPINDIVENIKYFVRYKIPSDEERRVLESLRQLLSDDIAARAIAGKQKRKSHRKKPGAG